jgi:hypothetical protein
MNDPVTRVNNLPGISDVDFGHSISLYQNKLYKSGIVLNSLDANYLGQTNNVRLKSPSKEISHTQIYTSDKEAGCFVLFVI